MKETKKNTKNVVVEVQLRDGSLSMYVGRLIKRTPDAIHLTNAAWVSCTGRRHQFFAGKYDQHTEVEPYPDGVIVELPAEGSIVTSWPHPLIREAL